MCLVKMDDLSGIVDDLRKNIADCPVKYAIMSAGNGHCESIAGKRTV